MSTDNYYILSPAADTKETGPVYPAVEFAEDYDFKSPNSVSRLKTNITPAFVPEVKSHLRKRANLTDVLSVSEFSGAGLLASENFLTFLKSCNTIPFITFETPIKTQSSSIIYYRIHFTWADWSNYVNWDDSNFFYTRTEILHQLKLIHTRHI